MPFGGVPDKERHRGYDTHEVYDSAFDLDLAYTYLQSLRYTKELSAAWLNLVIGAVAHLTVKSYNHSRPNQGVMPSERMLLPLAATAAFSPSIIDVIEQLNKLSQVAIISGAVKAAHKVLKNDHVGQQASVSTPSAATSNALQPSELNPPPLPKPAPVGTWLNLTPRPPQSINSGYCRDANTGEQFPPPGVLASLMRPAHLSRFAVPTTSHPYLNAYQPAFPNYLGITVPGVRPENLVWSGFCSNFVSQLPVGWTSEERDCQPNNNESVSRTLPISIPPMYLPPEHFVYPGRQLPPQPHSSPAVSHHEAMKGVGAVAGQSEKLNRGPFLQSADSGTVLFLVNSDDDLDGQAQCPTSPLANKSNPPKAFKKPATKRTRAAPKAKPEGSVAKTRKPRKRKVGDVGDNGEQVERSAKAPRKNGPSKLRNVLA